MVGRLRLATASYAYNYTDETFFVISSLKGLYGPVDVIDVLACW